jgi:hypothetical protein
VEWRAKDKKNERGRERERGRAGEREMMGCEDEAREKSTESPMHPQILCPVKGARALGAWLAQCFSSFTKITVYHVPPGRLGLFLPSPTAARRH